MTDGIYELPGSEPEPEWVETERDRELYWTIRRSDAYTNALRLLEDCEPVNRTAELGSELVWDYPDFFRDIRTYVYPALVAAAEEASREAARLRSRA